MDDDGLPNAYSDLVDDYLDLKSRYDDLLECVKYYAKHHDEGEEAKRVLHVLEIKL